MAEYMRKATASAEWLVGRKRLVRLARYVLNYARRDLPNRIDTNGELMVQSVVAAGRSDLVVFDVGANVGQWSGRVQATCQRAGVQSGWLHIFEPSAATCEAARVGLINSAPLQVIVNQFGLSDQDGVATLFKPHELAGSNSVYPVELPSRSLSQESIELRRLDEYCVDKSISHIDLLKIDAEGHDCLVLIGAAGMLVSESIDVIQFEYNYRWMGARRYLRDAFELLARHGYDLGKVTPDGIEWYTAWDPELETLREANYLACRKSLAHKFPSIKWWKEC